MQTICTLLQTDNHTNTSSLNFLNPNALPDAQPNSVKAQKGIIIPALVSVKKIGDKRCVLHTKCPFCHPTAVSKN